MWQTVTFDVLACMHEEGDLLLPFVTSFFALFFIFSTLLIVVVQFYYYIITYVLLYNINCY